jgi:hypothetical protein
VGILRRIKGRVSAGVGLVRDGIQAVNEEARHPGGAPGYKREVVEEAAGALESRETPVSERPVEEEAPGGGSFWFLDGENDGWEETNPGSSENRD